MCRDGKRSPGCGLHAKSPSTKTDGGSTASGQGGAGEGSKRNSHPAKTAGSSGAFRPLK
jgi:hypothetical protein